MTRGSFTVSGSVTDSASAAGIPGIFIQAQTGSECPQCVFAGSFTDSAGHYSVQVTSGQWKVRVNESDPAVAAGYVGPQERASLNVTGIVANVDFQLPKATALIYGMVKDGQGNPVPTVRVSAEEQNGNRRTAGRAVAPSGNYAVGVIAGSWDVGPDSDELASLGYSGQWTTVRQRK